MKALVASLAAALALSACDAGPTSAAAGHGPSRVQVGAGSRAWREAPAPDVPTESMRVGPAEGDGGGIALTPGRIVDTELPEAFGPAEPAPSPRPAR